MFPCIISTGTLFFRFSASKVKFVFVYTQWSLASINLRSVFPIVKPEGWSFRQPPYLPLVVWNRTWVATIIFFLSSGNNAKQIVFFGKTYTDWGPNDFVYIELLCGWIGAVSVRKIPVTVAIRCETWIIAFQRRVVELYLWIAPG